MYHSLFFQTETDYRLQRLLREAADDRLARSVQGRVSRWQWLLTGFKAVPATNRAAGCAG